MHKSDFQRSHVLLSVYVGRTGTFCCLHTGMTPVFSGTWLPSSYDMTGLGAALRRVSMNHLSKVLCVTSLAPHRLDPAPDHSSSAFSLASKDRFHLGLHKISDCWDTLQLVVSQDFHGLWSKTSGVALDRRDQRNKLFTSFKTWMIKNVFTKKRNFFILNLGCEAPTGK